MSTIFKSNENEKKQIHVKKLWRTTRFLVNIQEPATEPDPGSKSVETSLGFGTRDRNSITQILQDILNVKYGLIDRKYNY